MMIEEKIDEKKYTIIIYTENYMGVINRISIIFSRRRINIENFHVDPSEEASIKKFTIVIKDHEEVVRKVTSQIEKQVDVLQVHYQENTK